MTRQAEIDAICKWMRWKKVDECWERVHGEAHIPPTFDPFTSSADCVLVMDEVVRRDEWHSKIESPKTQYKLGYRVYIFQIKPERRHWQHYASTIWEAFCLALGEAIKE